MLIGIDGNEANIRNRVGSNIYAFKLLSWFQKLDRENDFSVYLKANPLDDFPKPNKNWNYRVLKPAFLWTRWRLPVDLYSHQPRPDVFFTPGHYAPKFCPVPLAISIMDLSFLHFPQMFRKRDLYKLTNWTRESIKKADHIFTISQFTKDDIIKNYAVPEEKITVTYPGVDEKLLNRITASDLRQTKKKHNTGENYLLFLGTLQPRKNLTRLIQAFAKLEDQKLKLIISGKKGWLYSKIVKEGERLGIEDRIIFTGYVPKKEALTLIKGAKAFVFVSLYEGFGIPVLEAMAAGTPTVVSKGSSLPEIVGDLGITVDSKNVKSITRGISRALQLNEDQRNEIAVKSKEQAKKFSWKSAACKTLEVLYALAV